MKRKKILLILSLLTFFIIVIVGIKRIDDKPNNENNKTVLVAQKETVFDMDLSPNNSYLQTVSYHGVSFMCPASWSVYKKVSAVYGIACEDNNTNAIRSVNFMWVNIEIPPEAWIEEGLKEAQDKLGSNKHAVSPIRESMFNTLKSKTIDISYTDRELNKKVYGKITSFKLKGGSCLVIMFNDTEIESDADFYAVEKSFEVKL